MKTINNKSIIRIKNLLWLKELDVAKLARCIGRSRTWTSQVLYGHQKSQATRSAIANALGLTVEELWPNNNKRKAA
jgi:lambda repressor-like predicted transcriptional regulator